MKRIIVFLLFVLLAISLSSCGRTVSDNPGANSEGGWKMLSKESGIIPGPVSFITDLIFFDESEGIATNGLQIKRTVDGGKEWTVVRQYEKIGDIEVHSFILDKAQHVWGVGSKDLDAARSDDLDIEETRAPAVMRSRDKGETWSEVEIDFGDEKKLSNESVTFWDICFTSPDRAWLGSNVGLIEAAVREPTIKIEKVFRTEEELRFVSCSKTGQVVGVGGKGPVYRYDDKGLSRLPQPSEFTFSKVKQIDDQIWLMGYKTSHSNSNSVETGMTGIVLLSANKGATWEDRTPKAIRFFSDLDLHDGKGWLTGSDGNLFYSNDNGESWRNVAVPTKSHLYDIFFLNKENIWIGGLNNTVLKYGID